MSTYLIDYENTNTAGLKGLENLSAADQVILFYGQNPGAIPFSLHVQMAKSKASFDYIKTEKVGKNYLDFQLVTYLGYLIATTKEISYIIISKDNGYESAIDFWKKKKSHLRIKRLSTIEEMFTKQSKNVPPAPAATASIPTTASSPVEPIEEAAAALQPPAVHTLSETYKKKIRTKIKAENLKGGSYNSIYNLFIKCHTKQNLNVGLVQAFQQERGNRLYKLLLPEFEAFSNAK